MTELSPAAQAVYDGFWRGQSYFEGDEFGACLAAALRAAVDQVVPESREHYPATFDEKHRKVSVFDVRNRLLAIADELEGK